MARLYTFPEQGWCSNAKKALGKYLAERYNMEYEPPGDNGYAWNSGSYWTIITASGKQPYTYDELEPLLGKPINESDIHIAVKTRKSKEMPDDYILLKELEAFNKQPLQEGRRSAHIYDQIRAATPKPMRKTKRSKRFLKNIITGETSLFQPTRMVNWEGFSIGTPVFDPIPLQARIKELRRRKLFLKRSRR